MQHASFPWHKLKDALLRRADVTQAYALEQGWGWRLTARIHELKKRDWPIETTYDGKRFAHYFLPKGWKPPKEKPLKKGASNNHNSQNTGGVS